MAERYLSYGTFMLQRDEITCMRACVLLVPQASEGDVGATVRKKSRIVHGTKRLLYSRTGTPKNLHVFSICDVHLLHQQDSQW